MSHRFARFAGIVLALAAAMFMHHAAAAEEAPLGLVIAYQTTPANRPVLRQQMREAELPQFEKWKREGVLQDYRILFSRYVDSANWDMMALLTFKPAGLERWKKIEETNPAGLSAKAAALTTSISTAPADLSRSHDLFKARDSVFLVIPYEVLIPTGEYLVPQTEGWMTEGVLAGYGLYVGKLAAGRPWASLLVLEYAGDEGLAQRESIVAKVRNRLKDNPKWKAIADSKQKVRAEKQAVVADALTLADPSVAQR